MRREKCKKILSFFFNSNITRVLVIDKKIRGGKKKKVDIFLYIKERKNNDKLLCIYKL